jgi:GcrA cell cycle regulator
MSWTNHQVERLKALWAEGKSASIVGELLGKTRSAICGKAFRLGLAKRETMRGERLRRTTDVLSRPLKRKQVSQPDGLTLPSGSPRPEPCPSVPGALPCTPLKSIDELRPWSCRYPMGDSTKPFEQIFCGRQTCDGSSYCSSHDAICKQPLPSKRVFVREAA